MKSSKNKRWNIKILMKKVNNNKVSLNYKKNNKIKKSLNFVLKLIKKIL